MTDTGTTLQCSSIDPTQMVVLQAKARSDGSFRVIRKVSVKTYTTFDDEYASLELKCPGQAGSATTGSSAPICVPAPAPSKPNLRPVLNGEVIEEPIGDKKGNLVVSMDELEGNGMIKFNLVPESQNSTDDEIDTVDRSNSGAFGHFAKCQPEQL